MPCLSRHVREPIGSAGSIPQPDERGNQLYYFGYDHDRIAEGGYREPQPIGYGNEKPKSGVELTDRPPTVTAYEHAFKVELPEDFVLPYEWPQESDHYWRIFRVPAEMLNDMLGFGQARSSKSDEAL